MTHWTDDFTHDHFTDGTYTVGALPSYHVGGGDLSVEVLDWTDEHLSGRYLRDGGVFTSWLRVDDITNLYFAQLRLSNLSDTFIRGLIYGPDIPSGVGGVANEADVTYGGPSFGGDFAMFFADQPTSGPVTITMEVFAPGLLIGQAAIRLKVTWPPDHFDESVLAIADADWATLKGMTLWPEVVANGRSGLGALDPSAHDVVFTEWHYDDEGGGPPPPPPRATMALGANPGSIPADASSTSDVTAYVRDHSGAGVPGLGVVFTPASHFGGAVTDNGDGTYDTTFTSDLNPGSVEVQAAAATLRATTAIRQRGEQGDMHAGAHQVGILRP
jgi:hypothetical protein